MLTLNTGQTPMSLRHQIEMLYLDLEKANNTGVKLIKESDTKPIKAGEYSFRDMVEGFNSYIERSELPIDRAELLDNIRSLENLAKESPAHDLFGDWIATVHAMTQSFATELDKRPIEHSEEDPMWRFAHTGTEAFKRSQAFTGLGAAAGKLRDFDNKLDLKAARKTFESIKWSQPESFLENLNSRMNTIRERATKIGNAQRLFFGYFFRELLNPDADGYRSPEKAIEPAFTKLKSQLF